MSEPNHPPRPQQRYLFSFDYENLEQFRLNKVFNDDSRCTEQVWIDAPGKREAAELGRAYADLLVMKVFDTTLAELTDKAYIWSNAAYPCAIEEDLQIIQAAKAQNLPLVTCASDLVGLFAE